MLHLESESLWENASNRLFQVYGNDLPIIIAERFNDEKYLFQNTGLIKHYRLADALRKHHITFNWYDDDTVSTFLAWIYNVNPVNPLPPHTVCHHCQRTVFHPEKRSGWDLPPTVCKCGAALHRDGHDVPLDWLKHAVRYTGLCPRIAVSEVDEPMVRQLIFDEYGDLWKLVAYEDISEIALKLKELFSDIHDRHWLLIPSDVNLSYPQRDGVYQIPGIPATEKAFVSLNIISLSICIRTDGQIHEYDALDLEGLSQADALMTEDIIRSVCNQMRLKEFGASSGESVLNIVDLPDFTSLTQAGSLIYGGDKMIELAECLVTKEGVPLQDLPTSIEDLCYLIVRSAGNDGDRSCKQADNLMNCLFDDRQGPLTASILRNLFGGIDIPRWLPEYLEKLQWLPYRFDIVYRTMKRLCREYRKLAGIKGERNSNEN